MDELAFGPDAPLDHVMATMRAMRRLKPDPVPRELLTQIVQSATLAPSGSNAQDYSWVVVDDPDRIAALAPLWARCHDLYMAVSRPAAGPTMSERQAEGLRRAVRWQRDHFAELPALIVPCYGTMSPPPPWETALPALRAVGPRHAADAARAGGRTVAMSEAASVYPGVQNLLLHARALGLGAVVTTWHLLYESELKRLLGIPRGVKTFAVVPVGWPKGRFGPVRRRPAAEAIRWNRW